MKTITLIVLTLMMSGVMRGQIINQNFEIFNTKIKARDITGGKKFDDLGVYRSTSIISNLTDDEATFLWRLGSVRINSKIYREGMFPLFDLSLSNSKTGYPILDEIDFEFYEKWGFPILEARYPKIKSITNYQEFKNTIIDSSTSIINKRSYLHNYEGVLKDSLLSTRYVINKQKVRNTVSEKISKNFSSEINLEVSAEYLKSLGIEDSQIKSVNNLIQKLLSNLILDGYFISARFDYRYIDIINKRISTIDKSYLQQNPNTFNTNLLWYIESEETALNSALFAFQFSGSKSSVDSLLIKNELSLATGINIDKLGVLSAIVSNKVNKEIERNFSNEFSKVWLIGFGTDKQLYYLNLQDVSRIKYAK